MIETQADSICALFHLSLKALSCTVCMCLRTVSSRIVSQCLPALRSSRLVSVTPRQDGLRASRRSRIPSPDRPCIVLSAPLPLLPSLLHVLSMTHPSLLLLFLLPLLPSHFVVSSTTVLTTTTNLLPTITTTGVTMHAPTLHPMTTKLLLPFHRTTTRTSLPGNPVVDSSASADLSDCR